jgi:hypothetical protein
MRGGESSWSDGGKSEAENDGGRRTARKEQSAQRKVSS